MYQAMLEEARRDVLPELSYRERKQAFLQSIMSELKASWKPDSMAWVNLHVAGYYYTLDGVTHPRQLASCLPAPGFHAGMQVELLGLHFEPG